MRNSQKIALLEDRVFELDERIVDIETFLEGITLEEGDPQATDLDLKYACIEKASNALQNDMTKPTIDEVIYFANSMYEFIKKEQ